MNTGDLIIANQGIGMYAWKRVDGQLKAIYEHMAGDYMTQVTEKK
jgi:hypothetical protein